jgi:hypothetical protein
MDTIEETGRKLTNRQKEFARHYGLSTSLRATYFCFGVRVPWTSGVRDWLLKPSFRVRGTTTYGQQFGSRGSGLRGSGIIEPWTRGQGLGHQYNSNNKLFLADRKKGA